MSKRSRQALLQQLKEQPEVSVLIVGAGVNGIGTFRDLAAQGVDVLLVDRSDFCSGASAASSRMVHGGIRYLENGEFRLVREAVQERNRLIKNAPHLVTPLPTAFPTFKIFSGLLNAPLKFLKIIDRPAERGALVIKVGMSLYDIYAGSGDVVPRHKMLNKQTSLAEFPRLNPNVAYTGVYYDGAMRCPERICIEMLGDAQRLSPQAMALNYVSLQDADGAVINLKDELSGEMISVRPRVMINACGPWIDLANQRLGKASQLIGGTKGSHLILDHPELRQAIGEHEFFFENEDGRIVLIYPFFDKVLIGTSDIRVDDPDQVTCTDEEIDYFFHMVGHIFPGIALDRAQIVFRYSGVRPLPYQDEGATGSISRDHEIAESRLPGAPDMPVYSLVGGKWTSFRAFSEQTTDRVLATLGLARKVQTHGMAIGGGANYPQRDDAQQEYLSRIQEQYPGLDGQHAVLFQRYGTLAERILAYELPGQDEWLSNLPEYSRREVWYLVDEEQAETLEDLVLRRTMLAQLGQLSHEGLRSLAQVMGEVRGWSAEQQREQMQLAKDVLARRHGVAL